jgi:hypothetical protein
MNIGVNDAAGAGNSKYIELARRAIEQELEKKQQEALFEAFGIKAEDDFYKRNMQQMIINMMHAGQEVVKMQKMFEEIKDKIQQEPTIEQLKKQIKYSKNPLEVKMLNRKLNKIYKERKMYSKL